MVQQPFFHEGRIHYLVYRLVYYSVIMLPVGKPEAIGMPDLIHRAQVRNASLGITGVLLSDDRFFSQLLEGPRNAVEAVMASIRRDPRHRDITVTEQGLQRARSFEGWSMQFVCDARARKALGKAAHNLGAHVTSADDFAAQMAFIVNKVPPTWSAPRVP
jgi:hypothetical protein